MTMTVTSKVHFKVHGRGRKVMRRGEDPKKPAPSAGRIPRVARLMALAIRFDGLIAEGAISDQAELARIGHVTRARVTQIMNLLHLASDLQEQVLFLPRVTVGRDRISERALRPIAAEIRWDRQREMWDRLASSRDA